MAYRGLAEEPRRAPQGGLVEEIVNQFADRFAYARELVQNSIDAGATTITVRVETSSDDLVVAFEDDGVGMSLEVIEGSLLTLFSSTKEGVANAIGRYGVGFKSVLAVDPTLVVVETHHASGAFVVELRRDHTFEVKAAPAAEGISRKGTTVRLILQHDAAHMAELRRALFGWCRHVRCPVCLVVNGARENVNVPFQLGGPVVLEANEDGAHVIVSLDIASASSPHDPPGSFAGFYSHGLTLLESTSRDPVREGLRFKVESRSLTCTISRDDVRRDKAFREVMKLVTRLAEKDLPALLAERLAQQAQTCGGLGALSPLYLELAHSAVRLLPADQIAVPLAEPHRGKNTCSLAWLREKGGQYVLSALGRTPLTGHVAARGHCIVLDSPDAALTRALDLATTPWTRRFDVLTEIAPEPSLGVMLQLVARDLEAVFGHPVELLCVEGQLPHGAGLGRFVGEPAASSPRRWLLPEDQDARPLRLLIPASEARARLAGATRPLTAAGLFARLVLLSCTGSGVDDRSNAILLARAAAVPL